jgi:hypothetical protein
MSYASKGEVSAPQQKMSVSPMQKGGAPLKAAPATEKRSLHLDFKKSS